MNIPDVFGQLRPALTLIGSLMIAAGLADFWGLFSMPKDGLQIAVAGWLLKNV